jgi:UrcA family protein
MIHSTRNVVIFALLPFFGLWQNVVESAEPVSASQTQSVRVQFADLDLDRPADIANLYHRITTAAQRSCGERELPGSHFASPSWEACVRIAVADAVRKVDRPSLSAYHRQAAPDTARKG